MTVRCDQGPREEHVLAASSVHDLLGENAHKIAKIQVNGVTIDAPVTSAAALRERYKAESQHPKGGIVGFAMGKTVATANWAEAKVMPKLEPTMQRVTAKLAPVQTFSKRVFGSTDVNAPRPPRLVEGVYHHAQFQIDLVDGQSFTIRAAILDRAQTTHVLQLSALPNAMAGCLPSYIACIPSLTGATTALGWSTLAYAGAAFALAKRDTRGCDAKLGKGNALLLTAGKLMGLALCDLVPVFSALVVYPSLLLSVKAVQHVTNADVPFVDTACFLHVLAAAVRSTGVHGDSPLEPTTRAAHTEAEVST